MGGVWGGNTVRGGNVRLGDVSPRCGKIVSPGAVASCPGNDRPERVDMTKSNRTHRPTVGGI